MTSKKKIADLQQKIDSSDQLYYNGIDSGVPDSVYDQWKDELKELNPDDERLVRVGAPILQSNSFVKREHTHFMGSQNKASTPEEFAHWYKNVGSPKVFVNLKVDGASVRAYYKDGKLDSVVTRGDGVEGEDIIKNASRWIDFPTTIDNHFNGSVRGEAVLYKKEWKIVDPDQTGNPRNIGSGIIQRLDAENNELMRFLAFDLTFDDNVKIVSEDEKDELLHIMDFHAPYHWICHNLDDVMEVYEQVQSDRPNLPFWIDGLVIKIDDIETQKSFGITNNRPKGQISFKFPPEQAESVIQGVSLAVGHTGTISVTAILKPTRLGGTTITNATLHNWDNINSLDVAIGDTVIIHKGGDIIPQVVEVKHRPNHRTVILEPTVCPECGGPAGRRQKITKKGKNIIHEPSAVTECQNPDCDAKGEGKIKRFIVGTDILGIGDALRQKLYEIGMVRTVYDLYILDLDTLSNVKAGNVLGEKRAKAILEEIDKKRKLTLEQFMGSLGINSLARGRVREIRKNCPGEFDTINDWLGTKIFDKAQEAGVPNIADKIYRGIQKIKPMIEDMIEDELIEIVEEEKETSTEGPLNGKKFILSGKFSVPKSEIELAITTRGGEIVDSVSKGVILVSADVGTTKYKKAEKLGCKIYDEVTFNHYLDYLQSDLHKEIFS